MCCDTGGNGDGNDGPYTGKPISLLSGAETFTRTDLTLGSLYPITIQRRYNSRSQYDSQVGYGWALNYDKRLYTYPDGSVTLRKECGWKRRFTLSDGVYVTPVGEVGTLVKNADGSFTYTNEQNEKENYDIYGRLASLVDAKGNSLVFTYEALFRHPLLGLLLANIDQNNPIVVSYDYRISKIEEKDAAGNLTGNAVSFQYNNSTGRLTTIWDSLGRAVAYTHDTIGNLVSVSGPSGSAAYGYNDSTNKHYLTKIDEGQGAYTNLYDSQGRVIQQIHAGGVIDIEYITPYTKTKVATTIKDSAGNTLNTSTRTVEFDANGQVVKNTDNFGNVTVYFRDANTWITREEYYENTGTVDAPNLVLKSATNFTYDEKGNMLTRTEAQAQGTSIEKTTTWTYHPIFSKVLTETVKSVVDPAQNRVITNTYSDTTGNLLTTTETGLLGNGTPYSYTTSYEHDTNGRITRIDGPRTDVQDVVTYYYDPITGFLNGINQPLVGTTTYTNHDPLGNPQTVTDPNGNVTEYTYDQIGRVLTVKAPGDTAATQYFYVSAGCTSCGGGANKIDHITLPEGNTIWYTYDNMGNLSAIKDNVGNSINYTYDSEGNRLTEQIKDSSGILQKTLSYQYDALNRVKRINNPDTSYTEYAYDFRGNRKSVKDPKGNATTYNYDALNRLIAVIQPGNITTSYEYNSSSNLTKVIDANTNATIYKYDDKARVHQVVSPDTGTTTYSYDPAGNMTSKSDAKAITVNYSYDALNRLTQITFPDTTQNIVYNYDNCLNGKGRLCRMTDPSGVTNYEYSAKGQATKETKIIDGTTYITQYAYDMNGNLKTMTYPSGRVITNNYSNDRAVSILNNAANLATNITYKPFGGITALTYGNGLQTTIGYDNQYRISSIQTGAIQNVSYTLDANGNITGITNNLDTTKNKSFTYDSLDRLTSGTGSWGSLAWTYDGVGNRQAQVDGGTTATYAYTVNKLTSITGAQSASFGYDTNGNTTSENSKEYIYNQNQRLIRVTEGGVTKGEYVYNGNGQRVKKVANGQTTVFHFNLGGQLIAESDNAGTITAEYVYLNNNPLAKIEGTNVYYYHNDHLGTPQKMTDSSGAVVWSADYKPFGEATVTVSTITNNLRFPGQYYDAETGLNYNYFRDYNPIIGRYVQTDPIGLQGGLNLYAYVGNSPMNSVDPYGLLKVKPGYEREFEMLERYNPYIVAMLTWIENNLPDNCEILISESFRTFEDYQKLYPGKGWNDYIKNRHAMLVALDISVLTKPGSKCKCNVSTEKLVGLAEQAGFKGFGYYDLHLHIDFRDTPATWKGKSK